MMTIPAWILDSFAAIMLAVAAVSAGRLTMARPRGRIRADSDVDAAHVLMGIAMAGMLVSSLHTLPNGVWAAVFAVITIWFGWQVLAEARAHGASALGTGHHLPHTVHGAAMVYMSVAITTGTQATGTGMSGMGAGASSMGTLRVPTLGLVFALLMAAWAVWDLDQIGTAHLRAHRPARLPLLAGGPQPAVALAAAGSAGPGPAGPVPAGADGAAQSASATWSPASAAYAPGPGAAGQAQPDTAQPAARLLDPRVAVACRIAMGITMAFMLVIML